MVTEWSNFRGGYYWWVQSLFIVPEYRGRGLVDELLEFAARAALKAGALDLRLYVLRSNERALAAYRRCGFEEAPYAIMIRGLGGGGGTASSLVANRLRTDKTKGPAGGAA